MNIQKDLEGKPRDFSFSEGKAKDKKPRLYPGDSGEFRGKDER